MQLVCIKKRIALTVLEAAHCPAAQKLKVPISNWGCQKSCCWEGVHQQSVALKNFEPDFPRCPYPECTWWVRFLKHQSIFHCRKSFNVRKLWFSQPMYNLEIYLIADSQRQWKWPKEVGQRGYQTQSTLPREVLVTVLLVGLPKKKS